VENELGTFFDATFLGALQLFASELLDVSVYGSDL
jgi:hypothetical protein